MLAVSDARLSGSNRLRGWCGFGLIRADRDLDGPRLAGAPLRDERGQAATEALRALGSDGHDATIASRRSRLARVIVTVPGAELVRERGIRERAGRIRGVSRDRLAVARRLGQADVPRDHRLEDAIAQVASDLAGDIGRQLRASVEHRQHDALDVEFRVQVVANEIESGQQLGQSFQGVVLALQRDEDRVGGGQCVDGQQPEGRRAIDEDVVVIGRRSRSGAG